ncbi:hypothetical protein [Kineosporia sp. NBRC 101731]|uniref:hypothetical protein n=1 Tax=Kineosporia sp. NBRC 101731 TaxID=3032199 RepID=UPI00255337A4|nr:hypothetical protein [Kineosporia sp. NBRC 101731]
MSSPETLKLRRATHALRLHLDGLPVDYNLQTSGDRFLAGQAFMFARNRYACAESMIGSGFGGTVIGAISRSLLVDGLRWLWIGQEPERRRALLGDLLAERNRLCILLETTDTSCPILPRWIMPAPDVADLTGASLAWLDAPSTPSDDELLYDFVDHAVSTSRPAAPQLLDQVRGLLNVQGLHGASLVLAHAGHGNYLGLHSTLTEDGVPGYDLRSDHEALYLHVAAVGTVATLLGTINAVPELWPADVEQEVFTRRAVALAEDVAMAAAPLHRLATSTRRASLPRPAPRPAQEILRAGAVLAANDLLPDVNSAEHVMAAAREFDDIAGSFQVKASDHEQPALHAILGLNGAHSTLQAVTITFDQPGSRVMAAFAARMLLEESARMTWRYSVASDPEAFKARATQYFDEFRYREKKTVRQLRGSGVPKKDAEQLFARPSNVQMITPNDRITANRQPIPSISYMLREMGVAGGYLEPGWLEVAYSLLSQVTHSTPIGHLHSMRFDPDGVHGGELSTEMMGLAIDVACLGSARLIGWFTVLITGGSAEALAFRRDLWRQAAIVHERARIVHGLD